MAFKPKHSYFAAFTAIFAAFAAFVFWGTWAAGVVPVMPDCPTTFPVDHVEDWLRGWMEDGKFVPGDVIEFLGSPYFWVELRYVLAAYCAALGMFYFLRGRGLSRLSSYSAGLFLAFSGYWLTLFSAGHLGWFRWMTYGVFAFGLADRAIAKGKLRHWLLLGACLAWASFHQSDLWLLFTVFTAVYFVYRCAATMRTGWRPPGNLRRTAIGCGIALAAFVAIGLPSFRSAIFNDLAGREAQMERGETTGKNAMSDPDARWKFVTNWSMPPEDTLEFAFAGIHGDTSCPMTLAIGNFRRNGIKPYRGRLGCPMEHENDSVPDGAAYPNYRQHSLYTGWITCLLALAALVVVLPKEKRMRGDILFFFACALVFWIFSMGRYCPAAYRIVFSLPMGDLVRAPVKWHHLTEFCLVALAGYGLDFIERKLRERGVLVATAVAAAIALVNVSSLAANAKLYCAPHTADTNLAPITQHPVPDNPAEAARFYEAVRKAGFSPAGTSPMPFKLDDGTVREFNILWVEQKMPRPPVRAPGRPLGPAAFTMAVCSVLSTGFVAGFLVLPLFVRRIGERRV